jgi:hypothetical protein
METRARRGLEGRPGRWRIALVALALLPLVGVWAYSVVLSARQMLALLDDRPVQPVWSVSAENIQSPPAAESEAAATAAAQTTHAGAVTDADDVRDDLVSNDTDATRELHSAADILPLLADYLIEADAEQTQQIAETVGAFLPPAR